MSHIISNNINKEWVTDNKPNKNIVFCCKYINLQLAEAIINIFKDVFKNEAISIRFIIENNTINFLNGYSDLSAIELLKTYKNVSIKSKQNINMNIVLIDESLLINAFSCKAFEKLFIKGLYVEELAIQSREEELINQCIYKCSYDLSELDYIQLVENYVKYILQIDNSQLEFKLYGLLFNNPQNVIITTNTIPQFSQFTKAVYDTPRCIICSGNNSIDYNQLGKYLLDIGKNDAAYKKYGENHSKFAQLIGFTCIDCSRPRKIHITKLGEKFYNLEPDKQNRLIIYQLFKLDIVRAIVAEVIDDPHFRLEDYLKQYLSISTVGRRGSSIKQIFKFIMDKDYDIAKYVLNQI